MNNVFVLCAGRTASTAFERACSHIENYSSAHESRVGCLGYNRVAYPEHHIEIDNRLSWFLPYLEEVYGEQAFYIYLTRDREKIAQSYLERWHLDESIVKAYGHGLLMRPKIKKTERYDICLDYVDHVNASIQQFLKNKPNTLTIDVTELNNKFAEFYNWIGAKGDLTQCLYELTRIHNKNNTNRVKKMARDILGIFK